MEASPAVAQARLSKENAWYLKDIGPNLNGDMRKLLKDYSKVPADEIEAHIYKCRDIAWQVRPYPCIGNFWFLKLGLSQHPSYPGILASFKANPSLRFLDLGTCFGQDLRKLAFDGAPIAGLYGSDMYAGFEEAGHALFRDADTWAGKFIVSNILDPKSPLAQTEGTWDVVHISMFLHVFNLEYCKLAARQILKLLKPKPGSLIVGTQSGSIKPGDMPLKPPYVEEGSNLTVYRHSCETFSRMWEELAKELGVRVDVQVGYGPQRSERATKKSFFSGDDVRRLIFSIKLK